MTASEFPELFQLLLLSVPVIKEECEKKPIDYICALRYEYEFTTDGIVQGIDTAG
jgi:hypothetical protein